MSTEILRRAAALMHERAEAATPGPWEQSHEQDGEILADGTGYAGDHYPGADVVALDAEGYCTLEIGAGNVRDAAHIASWHPVVALTVADMLVRAADAYDAYAVSAEREAIRKTYLEALRVARTYLGEGE